MKNFPGKFSPAMVLRLLLLATIGICLCKCGVIVGPIAGGSSEVGNPEAAIYGSGKKDTASEKVTGVKIDFQGIPIRIVREPSTNRQTPDSASAISETQSDSLLDMPISITPTLGQE